MRAGGEQTLAEVARGIDLHDCLRLGKARSMGREQAFYSFRGFEVPSPRSI